MTAAAIGAARTWPAPWRNARAVLALAIGLLLLLFADDVAALARLWWTSSSYEHCLLVPPIVAALIWSRRRELAALSPTGWAPGLLLVAGGAGSWLLGEIAGAAVLRQAGLVAMAVGCVAACLGPAVAKGLAFPLAYLVFLVPVGEAWEPPLQLLTARWASTLLHLTGVPAQVDGVFITTPAGLFEVAEACSGVKFLVAMIALAVLAANLGFRSWPRRAALVAVAAVLPVAANALRAWGTMAIAERIGAARAGGFDHLVYGWVFFALVTAALLGGAWAFFDRDPAAPAFDPQSVTQARIRLAISPAIGALATVAIASAALAWAARVEARPPAVLPAVSLMPAVPGWQRAGSLAGTWRPRFAGADRIAGARFRDGAGHEVELVIAVFARQTRWVSAVGYGQGATPPGGGWTWDGALGPGVTRIVGPRGARRDVAARFAVGGVETSSEARVKLETLRLNLLGGRSACVAVLVAADERRGGVAAANRFLRAMGPLVPLAAALTGG